MQFELALVNNSDVDVWVEIHLDSLDATRHSTAPSGPWRAQTNKVWPLWRGTTASFGNATTLNFFIYTGSRVTSQSVLRVDIDIASVNEKTHIAHIVLTGSTRLHGEVAYGAYRPSRGMPELLTMSMWAIGFVIALGLVLYAVRRRYDRTSELPQVEQYQEIDWNHPFNY